MKWLNYFRFSEKKQTSATLAKERLQIIVAHESTRQNPMDIIQSLQKELVTVISKYVTIDPEQIKVQLERNGDYSILELNVTLPELQPQKIPAIPESA